MATVVENPVGGALFPFGDNQYVGQTFVAAGSILSSVEFRLDYQQGLAPLDFKLLITQATFDGSGFRPGAVLFESAALSVPVDGDTDFDIFLASTGNLALTPGQTYAFIMDSFVTADAQTSETWVRLGNQYSDGQWVVFFAAGGTRADHFSGDWTESTTDDLAFRLVFNTPPAAANDAVAVNEDSTAVGNVITGGAGGAGQDIEPEGESFTVTGVIGPSGPGTVGQPLAGAFGALTLNADGSYSYSPNNAAAQALIAGQSATEVFTYQVSDVSGGTATATLTFNIAGQDEVFLGGPGPDYVYAPGFGGHDQIDGGGGDDHLEGGNGNDRLFGGTDSDSLLGGDGTDHLDGGAGSDRLYGGAGNDSLLGGAGDDRLDGEAGDDLLYGGEGSDGVIGGDGNDRLEGEGGNDTMLGGDGNDGLIGGDGDDVLDGGDGNDVLQGGAGTDYLTGGAGDDILDGGAGTDGFIFAVGFGKDIIQNFEGGPGFVDNIRLHPGLFGGGPADFDAVLARAADDGAGNVIITFDAATQLSITGITKVQLAADDFSFA